MLVPYSRIALCNDETATSVAQVIRIIAESTAFADVWFEVDLHRAHVCGGVGDELVADK